LDQIELARLDLRLEASPRDHRSRRDVRETCELKGRILITTQYRPYPHTNDGFDVRRIFHELRSRAIENFNGHFKGIFDPPGHMPTKGFANTQRFVLGAILVYQLALLYRFEHGLDLRVGPKAF
jgi:hypothetical protein